MADTMSNVCHMIIIHIGIYHSFMLTPYIFVSSIKKLYKKCFVQCVFHLFFLAND